VVGIQVALLVRNGCVLTLPFWHDCWRPSPNAGVQRII
jgi:hypothetical protein